MSRRNMRRRIIAGTAAGIVVAGGLLLSPGTPTPASHADDAAEANCTVDAAELRWGVRESFRNYVSGSIANGEWTTENGATYETPAFIWDNGTGSIDSDLSEGSVEFNGDVHFTGHGGAMRLDLSNPEIVFTGDESAQLVLDMGSADVEGAQITYEPVVAAKIDLSGYDTGDGSIFSVEAATVSLTADGADAFNGEFGDYISGQELDPLALEFSVSGCSLAESTGEPAPVEEDDSEAAIPAPISAEPEETEIPWLPIIVGGVALVVIGVTVGMLIAGRNKAAAAAPQEVPPTDPPTNNA